MALHLELVLTLALAIAAIKLGWLWTILFVLFSIIAFSFKLSFLSHRTKVMPYILAFLAEFLSQGAAFTQAPGRDPLPKLTKDNQQDLMHRITGP